MVQCILVLELISLTSDVGRLASPQIRSLSCDSNYTPRLSCIPLLIYIPKCTKNSYIFSMRRQQCATKKMQQISVGATVNRIDYTYTQNLSWLLLLVQLVVLVSAECNCSAVGAPIVQENDNARRLWMILRQAWETDSNPKTYLEIRSGRHSLFQLLPRAWVNSNIVSSYCCN